MAMLDAHCAGTDPVAGDCGVGGFAGGDSVVAEGDQARSGIGGGAAGWRHAPLSALHLPMETDRKQFGGIPAGLPNFTLPEFRLDQVLPLFPSALTVALLAAVESLLSAVVADGMSGTSTIRMSSDWRRAWPIRVAFIWRHSRDGRDCPHGDEHPGRRQDARSGIIHAVTLLIILAGSGASGSLRSVSHSFCGSLRSGVQHGRVARDRYDRAAFEGGNSRVGRHVRADRLG